MKNLVLAFNILLVVLFTFSSCSNSLNEEDIRTVFFDKISNTDELNKLQDYSYQFSNKISYYYRDFYKSDTSWEVENSKYSNTNIIDGQYIVRAYQEHMSWYNLDYDQTKDFQIDMTMTNISWGGIQSKDFTGLLFNITKNFASGISLIIKHSNSKKQIVVFDITNKKDLFQTSKFTINTPVTFTIRKIKGNISFFINKKFLYKTQYNHINSSIGYIISEDSTIAIDNVQVVYLK